MVVSLNKLVIDGLENPDRVRYLIDGCAVGCRMVCHQRRLQNLF